MTAPTGSEQTVTIGPKYDRRRARDRERYARSKEAQ